MKMLMVTYGFPPRGGGGVQRNVKFLKYLSRFGVETSVLTVKESEFYVYDTTLLKEIEDGTKIYRADSMDILRLSTKLKKIIGKKDSTQSGKSNIKESAWYISVYRKFRDLFLLPDAYSGWIPFAVKLGKKIIKEDRPDVIFGSFPGPTNAFVTYKLAKKFKIPYILDFRDGWLDDPYVKYPSFIHRKYHQHHERKIVRNADKVIVNTKELQKLFSERYPDLIDRLETMTNGFDPEDMLDLVPAKRNPGKIRIVYSGAIFVDRRENVYNLIKGINLVEPDLKNQLEIIFVGPKHEWANKLIEDNGLKSIVSFTGYKPHKEALNYLSSADAALLFLAKGDKVAIPGKLYEYLGLGLPVIACVEPDGACANLLESLNHNKGVCGPDNPELVAEKVRLLVKGELPKLNKVEINNFSRKVHSQRLKGMLEKIVLKEKKAVPEKSMT